VGMALVDAVLFFCLDVPFVLAEGWEEGIGLGGCVGYLGETEAVGEGKGLTIDALAADDVDVFVGRARGEGGLERGEGLSSRESVVGTCQNNIAAVGKGSLGEALERLTTHDDGVAGGEGLEALQVVG